MLPMTLPLAFARDWREAGRVLILVRTERRCVRSYYLATLHHPHSPLFHLRQFCCGQRVEIDGGVLDGTGAVGEKMQALQEFGLVVDVPDQLTRGFKHTMRASLASDVDLVVPHDRVQQ